MKVQKIRSIKKNKTKKKFRVLGLGVNIFWGLNVSVSVGVKPTLHPKPTCYLGSTVWVKLYNL
jgi:hypothetical protein